MRTSAPNSSAISTMAEAAPGELPQIAALPGNTFQRHSAQPVTPLAAMEARITVRNRGHSAAKVRRMSGVTAAAIIVPTTACARL